MKKSLKVRDLLEKDYGVGLQLELAAGEKGLNGLIQVRDINRPGLTIAGYYDFFAYDRIQLFGRGETAFMRKLSDEEKKQSYKRFFSYDVKCCIFSHGERPDPLFIQEVESRGVPVLVTRHDTTRFSGILNYVLDDVFAPSVTLHGTLVDVNGIGILIIGNSGVGKSECALELIERGHRLIGDDVVEIKKLDETILSGSGSPLLRHHLEIRGIGIINVKEMFGIRSVKNRKPIDLVIKLEDWDNEKEYDRLGLDDEKYTILDVDVPCLLTPVRPGRNIPIIIEAASLNQRLKKMGIFSARQLDEKIQNWLKTESSQDV